tara:strand:+ start:378 stop:746 length:369 start_codon:yes stop_codon:yes gene_type:complete
MNKNQTYDLVKEILTKVPETRDSDVKLTFKFYTVKYPDFYQNEDNQMNVRTFFETLENNDFISESTIRRCRRKIQETIPYLRGDVYATRMKKATKEMKGFIKHKDYTETVSRERHYHLQKLS